VNERVSEVQHFALGGSLRQADADDCALSKHGWQQLGRLEPVEDGPAFHYTGVCDASRE